MVFEVDINCDLGEAYGSFEVGNDQEIMPFITSANIACGFHAGGPSTIIRTMNLARRNEVSIGAHPGFPDLMGFGRRRMEINNDDLRNIIIYQIGALEAFAKTTDMKLQHVKPHGALYNIAAEDATYAKSIIEAVQNLDSNLVIFTSANSKMARLISEAGLRVGCEVFADRAYKSDGSLVSRNMKGAILSDPELVAERAVEIVKEKKVTAITNHEIRFENIHTICVHSDTPNAVDIVKTLKRTLVKANIEVKPIGSFI
jgi:UPF0271 protein